MIDFLKLAQSYEENIIEDLRDLIKINSVKDESTKGAKAPFGASIREALDFMLDKATRDHFQVEDLEGYAGIIEFGEGEEIVSMLGHLDIVPIGEGWTKDPLGGEIVDGYLYGRGSGDDKGPTIAAYYALKIIQDLKLDLKRRIWLILGTDEESGMECMDYFVKHHQQPTMGFVPDASFPAIYGESGILITRLSSENQTIIKRMRAGSRPNVVIGEAEVLVQGPLKKETFEFYLSAHRLTGNCFEDQEGSTYTIYGKAFHGAWPHKGVNAGYHILNFVANAYEDPFLQKIAEGLSNSFGDGLGIAYEGEYMGSLTMNLGLITIEDELEIILDIRYPNDIKALEVIENMKNTLAELDLDVAVQMLEDSPPLFVDPNSPLVSVCMETYREFTNDQFTPAKTMRGGTYARKLQNHIAFGPDFPGISHPKSVGGAHEKDEAINVESLILATAIYAKTLYRLAVDVHESS